MRFRSQEFLTNLFKLFKWARWVSSRIEPNLFKQQQQQQWWQCARPPRPKESFQPLVFDNLASKTFQHKLKKNTNYSVKVPASYCPCHCNCTSDCLKECPIVFFFKKSLTPVVALQSYHQDHHVKNLTSGLNEVFWKKLFILSGCEVVEEEQDLSGALLFNKKCAEKSTNATNSKKIKGATKNKAISRTALPRLAVKKT